MDTGHDGENQAKPRSPAVWLLRPWTKLRHGSRLCVAPASAHDLALLATLAGVAAAAALALEPFARALAFPTPLAFLLGGLALGELWDGSHPVARPDDIAIFGTVALIIVLLNSGFACGFVAMRAQLGAVLALGVVGTAATFGLVALAAHVLIGLDWTLALLLGAVLSPTDPAAVYAAVSRTSAGGSRVVRLLEAEAGINDPVAIALTVALVGAAQTGHIHASSIVRTTAREGVLGVAVGVVAGVLAARVLGPRWPTLAMAPPLAVLAGGFATFGLAVLAHGSGFVAVYLYGLVVGDDSDLPQADAVRSFGQQLASLAEIAMFVMLGVALAQVPLRASFSTRRYLHSSSHWWSARLSSIPPCVQCAVRAAMPCSRPSADSKARSPSCSRRCPYRLGS